MRISESIFRMCRNIRKKKKKVKGPVLKNSSIPTVDFEHLIYIGIRNIKIR